MPSRLASVASLLSVPLAFALSWLSAGASLVMQLAAYGLAIVAYRTASTPNERRLAVLAIAWAFVSTVAMVAIIVVLLVSLVGGMGKGL